MTAETVLVVDDDPDIRDLYRRFLEGRGFRVFEAEDLVGANAILAQLEVDAIVLDLELAEGDTTPLLEMLSRRSHPPPAILATTSTRGSRIAQRYHIAELEKFELASLGREIERAIDEGRRPRLSRISGPLSSGPRSPRDSRVSIN